MISQASLWREVALHEGRVMLADRSLLMTTLLLVALVAYALYNGIADTQLRDAAIAQTLHNDEERVASTIARLGRVMAGKEVPEPFANPADATSVGGAMAARHATMPSTPLAPIAFGQSDMLSSVYLVVVRSKVNFMNDSEIENPWNLLSGRFDLAFVITYLVPLLIFGVSYNLLAAEREQGTLRMLLSQPLQLRTLVLGKLSIRAGVVLGVTIIIPIAVLLALRPETRDADQIGMLAIWVGLVIAYGLFWFSLAGLVNAFGKSSALNALVLITSWIALVLVVPLVLNIVVSYASPAPSRTELATMTRLIASDSSKKYDDLLRKDYEHVGNPQALLPRDGRFEVPSRLKAFFLMAAKMDTEIQDELDRFDRQLAGQQRLVNRFGFVSPAILMNEGMTTLAGNGVSRFQHFQSQVQGYHKEWRAFFQPRIVEGIAITENDFGAMPRWKWVEQDARIVRADALLQTFYMLLVAGLLTMLCILRLRKYAVV